MSKCSMKCEVYSRVTGYMRPVSSWNKGKREEFKDRKSYSIEKELESNPVSNEYKGNK